MGERSAGADRHLGQWPGGFARVVEAALHIADLTRELAELARRHPDLGALAYLLEMARLEAEAQAERHRGAAP